MSMRASNLMTRLDWTPTLMFNGVLLDDVSVGGAYTAFGHSFRIGPFVWIYGGVTISTKGTPTGAMSIGGAPYNSDNTYILGFSLYGGWAATINSGAQGGITATPPSIIYPDKMIAGTDTAISATDLGTPTTSLFFYGFYMTAA